jgi:hypothetical protein
MRRSVLTVATGRPVYVTMALTLARSFFRWNSGSNIEFFLVTDQSFRLPRDLEGVNIIRVRPGELGLGFGPKLLLDQLAPTEATLFIDADSLCFGELNSAFDRFRGHAVSVVGWRITHREWSGDVDRICALMGLSSYPQFNGGIYYLERGANAQSVYRRARELEKDYDVIGLVRLRGCPNEEPLMALAMALEGCAALPDDGTILGDLCACPKIDKLDVIRGVGQISNPPPGHPAHRKGWPIGERRPRVIHFLGNFTSHYAYRAEELTLKLVCSLHIPVKMATALVSIAYRAPAMKWNETKSELRPLYHQMFGPRRVKQNKKLRETHLRA